MEEGGSLVVKELRVANKGWEFLELSDAEQATSQSVSHDHTPTNGVHGPHVCTLGLT